MITLLLTNPILFLLSSVSLVIAITIHEFAHAKMADHLGDPTPRLQGRVTLNPAAHLDLYGTIFLLLVGFGWGKPVQFDPFNLDNARKDAALISIVGPVSNFLLAIASSVVLYLFTFFGLGIPFIIGSLLIVFIQMNILLGVFNLLPVHPLDGFKIVEGLLNEQQAREWHQLERYGFLFLIALILPIGGQSMLHTILDPVMSFLNGLLIPGGIL